MSDIYIMALFTIETPPNYSAMIQELLKYIIYIFIFHILLSLTYDKKGLPNFGMAGSFMNGDFLNVLIVILLTIMTYHLVVKELIEVK